MDTLVEQYAKTTREVVQINQLLKAKMAEIDQILDTASKLASSMTNYTGIAIKPKASSVTMSKFELVSIDERQFAMVMITAGGTVKTKKVKAPGEVTPELLRRLAELLNENLCGKGADMALRTLSELFNGCLCGLGADRITLPIIMELENAMGEGAYLVNPAVKCVYEVMNEIDGGEMRLAGVNRLLNYPEYSDTQQFGELLGTLEDQDEILDLVSSADSDDINVLIGSESPVKVMNNSALVFKPIKKNGRTVGVIGVLGPRRMNYKQVLETIDDLVGNISGMIGSETPAQNTITGKGENDGGE